MAPNASGIATASSRNATIAPTSPMRRPAPSPDWLVSQANASYIHHTTAIVSAACATPAPGRMLDHDLGDLRDREHEDQVEEQFHRRDPFGGAGEALGHEASVAASLLSWSGDCDHRDRAAARPGDRGAAAPRRRIRLLAVSRGELLPARCERARAARRHGLRRPRFRRSSARYGRPRREGRWHRRTEADVRARGCARSGPRVRPHGPGSRRPPPTQASRRSSWRPVRCSTRPSRCTRSAGSRASPISARTSATTSASATRSRSPRLPAPPSPRTSRPDAPRSRIHLPCTGSEPMHSVATCAPVQKVCTLLRRTSTASAAPPPRPGYQTQTGRPRMRRDSSAAASVICAASAGPLRRAGCSPAET